MGQTLQLWSFRIPMQVVGVFKDLPANTDLEVKMAGSYATFRKINNYMFDHEDWGAAPWPSQCYMLLPAGASVAGLNADLHLLVRKYYPIPESGKPVTSLSAQPLTAMHLDTDYGTFKGDALTPKELWALGLTGFFLLLVACVNFINLSTAQSVNRAKEIGVRKVLGSSRPQILRQFLGETALLTIGAIVLGILLARLVLPFISELTRKPLSLDILDEPLILLFIVALGICVNLLAGFYPGLVLAGFNPVQAIKSKIMASSSKGIALRRGLVVFQFVIAQLLIIGTIVVLQQMHFFRNQPMGFDSNAVAFIDLPSDSTDQEQHNYLKAQMLAIPGVQAASYAMDMPASWGSNNQNFYYNASPAKKDFTVDLQFADTGYLSTFKIGLKAGRLPYPSDTMRELMVNETLVKRLGTTEKDIIGKPLSFDGQLQYPVVGVFQDFHSKSLKEELKPMALGMNKKSYGLLALRFDPEKLKTTLPQVEKTFTNTYPTYIYELDFLDERIAHFYTSEAMAATLFKIAAFFAIFISCLGLYGLVSFMALRKTKEVGIRKVLGASVSSIVLLFSREFILLLGIAFLIASPIGYFLMRQWLEGFKNHVMLSWLVFAAAIFASALIALATVGYKAIAAALADPVKSIRTE